MIMVDLPAPPSANRLWRQGRMGGKRGARAIQYASPEYTAWKQSAGILLNCERRGMSITGRAKIEVRLGKQHALRDGDNSLKPLCDLCQLVGLVANDNQFRDWHIWFDDRVPKGRCVMIVSALNA